MPKTELKLDQIVKKVRDREITEKKRMLEMAKFENELLDSLLFEIKRGDKVLQEYSFFGAIAGIFKKLIGDMFSQWKENFMSSFDSHTGTIGGSISSYSKKAGIKEAKTIDNLDPENDPKDLVIWGISQMTVHEGAESGLKIIKNFLNGLNSLESPIPDPTDEESQKSFQKGGAAAEILDKISKAGGYAKGTAAAIAKNMPKVWSETVKEMDSITKDFYAGKEGSTCVDVLESIKLFCDTYNTSNYVKAMNGAAKTAEQYEWADKNIDPSGIVSEANEIFGTVDSQISRLNSAKAEIEKKAKEAGIEAKAGDITANAEKLAGKDQESMGKGQFESKLVISDLENKLLNELLSEIKKRR